MGIENSLSTPHQHELGVLSPGKHRLTIRVDNRVKIDVGINAHSVTDHTQTNWNGLVGRLELQARDPIWIGDVQVYPDVRRKTDRSLFQRPAPGFMTLTNLAQHRKQQGVIDPRTIGD